jgi:hypothetical protein
VLGRGLHQKCCTHRSHLTVRARRSRAGNWFAGRHNRYASMCVLRILIAF